MLILSGPVPVLGDLDGVEIGCRGVRRRPGSAGFIFTERNVPPLRLHLSADVDPDLAQTEPCVRLRAARACVQIARNLAAAIKEGRATFELDPTHWGIRGPDDAFASWKFTWGYTDAGSTGLERRAKMLGELRTKGVGAEPRMSPDLVERGTLLAELSSKYLHGAISARENAHLFGSD